LNKRVLFIAYGFPPAGGAGVQRSLKFVKYLPQFGWQPVVITTTADAYPVRDETMLADIPTGTPIYRVRGYDINGLRPAFNRLKLGKVLSAINVALMLPDAALLWARLARSVVRHVVDEHRPRLIYSSSHPASAHLLGLWSQRAFNLPWIADFRDPWSENLRVPFYPGYRAVNRRMERQVLTRADQIVTLSRQWVDMFQRLSGNKFSSAIIENGYDEDDVAVLPPPQTKRFTITYTGTFSHLHRPDAFNAAVDQLIASGQIPLEQIRVAIAGKDTAKYIPNHPPFELLGYLSHDALDKLRRQSNLLLLVISESPKSRGTHGGKVYEYMGSNRPTLAITHPENVAAQLIERARAGFVVRHNSYEIAKVILRCYRNWQTGRFDYAPDWGTIRQYTRRNLTARLAAEFDRLAAPEEVE